MHTTDRSYPTDSDRDDAALIHHWTHFDENAALIAAQEAEMERDLCADGEFIAEQERRRLEDLAIEGDRRDVSEAA